MWTSFSPDSTVRLPARQWWLKQEALTSKRSVSRGSSQSNLPKMKDEDALELYVKLKKSYKRDRGLMRYIFDETDKIAKE